LTSVGEISGKEKKYMSRVKKVSYGHGNRKETSQNLREVKGKLYCGP